MNTSTLSGKLNEMLGLASHPGGEWQFVHFEMTPSRFIFRNPG